MSRPRGSVEPEAYVSQPGPLQHLWRKLLSPIPEHRPTGVAVLSWLYRAGGLLGVLMTLLALLRGSPLVAAVTGALALSMLAVGFGLSRLRRWSWFGALAVSGLAFAGATSKMTNLSLVYAGSVAFHGFWLAYLLVRREVFLGGSERAGELERTGSEQASGRAP